MPARTSFATAPLTWREEAAATVTLAAPLVLAQLVQMAIYTTDVLMLGQLGAGSLAAAALAVNLLSVLMSTGIGLVSAAAPLMASALGEKRHAVRDVRRSFRAAVHAAVLYVLPAWVLLWNGERLFLALGQDPFLSAQAGDFLRILQWALLPNLLLMVFRSLLAALGRPTAALVVMLLGLVLNALGNWVLIFGHWGAPALGLTGSAIASVAASLIMVLALGGWLALERRTRRYHLFGRIARIDRERLAAIFRIGTPIALTLAFEVSVFSAAIYLMGWIDTDSVAAHAIALQIAAFTFMVPLGLSQATVVRVGLAFGARDRRWVALAGWVSLALALAFMSVSALAMWLFPREIAGLFLDSGDPGSARVLDLAVGFLAIAALFQLFDGAQVIGAAMLRGLQDTRVPMLFALFGYWVAGLGSGYLLAFAMGWRGIGIWAGLALGLGVVAVLMLWRWSRREVLGLMPWPRVAPPRLQPIV